MKPLALLIPAAFLLTACSAQMTAFDEGVRLYRDGSYASARDAFDSAAQANPRSATSISNRGVAKARLGDVEGAIADYTQAMQLAPADADIAFNRGNAYAAVGNLPAAIGDFTTAVTLSPGHALAYFNRGTVRAATGDVAGAASDWQWAVEVERDPWTKAAMRRSASLDYVSASPGRGPQALDVRAYVARALSREVEGDRLGAIADLRAAVMMETDATRRERIDGLLRALESSR